MPGNYSHTSRSTGTVLTAAIYNGDHQNHIDFQTPPGCDDYSATTTEMRTETDPFPAGAVSRPTSLAGELERIRFILGQVKTGNALSTFWYENRHAQGDPVFAESFSL